MARLTIHLTDDVKLRVRKAFPDVRDASELRKGYGEDVSGEPGLILLDT